MLNNRNQNYDRQETFRKTTFIVTQISNLIEQGSDKKSKTKLQRQLKFLDGSSLVKYHMIAAETKISYFTCIYVISIRSFKTIL